MGRFLRFLRDHPWYRRLLTASLAMAVAAGAAVLAYPWAKQRWLIHQLRTGDAATARTAVRFVRALEAPSPELQDAAAEAMVRWLGAGDESMRRFAAREAVALGQEHPRVTGRYERALSGAGDAHFLAIVDVLRELGAFDPSRQPGERIDRLRAIEAETAQERIGPHRASLFRQQLVAEAVLDGRDNEHVRRLLNFAATGESWRLRESAALLAAGLGADDVLAELLADEEPMVVTAAALAAGAARREALFDGVAERIGHVSPEASASACWAAVRLRPEAAAPLLGGALTAADEPGRERLLHVAGLLGTGAPRDQVLRRLEGAREANAYPEPMALLAAGGCELTDRQRADVAGDVSDVLTAARDGTCSELQMLAALSASRRLELDVLADVIDLLDRVRSPERVPLLIRDAVARVGEQVGARPPEDALRREGVARLAYWARYYDPAEPTGTDFLTMPRVSAVAAAELWRLNAPGSAGLLRAVAGEESPVAGDIAAWRAARAHPARAVELGLEMLPSPDAPPLKRVHNSGERAIGAVLLGLGPALAPPAERQRLRDRAAGRLRGLLEAGRIEGEGDPEVLRAIRGSLAALGEEDMLAPARRQLARRPSRRTLTTLLAADPRWLLDELLVEHGWTAGQIDTILIGQAAGEVLAAAAPHLPRVEPAAPELVRLWQIRILRTVYVLSGRDEEAGL